jgi:hypothetical protein
MGDNGSFSFVQLSCRYHLQQRGMILVTIPQRRPVMRSALLPILALAFATPAVAAPSESQRDMNKMAERLNDPQTQSAMSGALTAMLGALLDMRIDGVAKALEPMNRGKPIKMKGRTIREIASRDDPRFEQKLAGGSRAMVSGAGALASAMATMLPEIEQALAKVSQAMDNAKYNLPEVK